MSRTLLRLVLATALLPCTLRAQGGSGSPPEVARAQAHLTAGRADSAVAILEAFLAKTPAAPAARLLLGDALRQMGELDRAVATWAAVTQPRPMALQARFRTAILEVGRNRTDEAFRLLHGLKASGAFDMDLVRDHAQLASLRNDARFAQLAFQPGDFRHPFVEPVRVIHEWVGETKGDQFSWIARGIGDVDGDRIADVVTSAPTYGAGGQPVGRGRVYVYSGRTGALIWQQTGSEGEALGIGLEGAGDVDRDGAGDVIAGAPGSGKAYVYSGRDGRQLLALASGDRNESFGNSAAGAGDQDGDGVPDLVVGAPGASSAGQGAGRAYVFSGKDGSRLATLDGEGAGDAFGSIVAGVKAGRRTPLLVGAPGAGPNNRGRVYVFEHDLQRAKFVVESDATGAALGAMFTSVVGDVDGDGVEDIYASDYTNAASGPATGRVYVHSGATGKRLRVLTGERAGDAFGIGSADVGDVDGDGHADLLVGAWQYAAVAPSGGRVYLYSGKDGTLLRTITGRIPGETFGFDATGVGDVDGDGVPDFLVTSTWSNIRGFQSGRMFLISGR